MEEKTHFKQLVVVVVIGVLLYCGIQNYKLFTTLLSYLINLIFPFILGGIIAFIVNVPMRALERHLLSNVKAFDRFRRGTAFLLTLILIIGILSLALFVIIPELSNTGKMIITQVPTAFDAFQQWLYKISDQIPNARHYIDQLDINWNSVSDHAIKLISATGSTLFSSGISIVSGIIGGITTFFIAFVFSIYLILQKERLARQTKRLLFAYLPQKKADRILYIARLSNRIFSSFLSGQCIEALILGTMFFVTLSILKFPYALLIGVVIALTALIPIFGAFIGCAIGVFLIVMVNPMQAVWFVVVFLILQQVEGNLIYPHVVGGSIGLPSIWVLAAVTVGGSLFGIAGILFFIPLCSVFYSLLRESVNQRLDTRKLGPNVWDTPPVPPERKKQERPTKKREKINTTKVSKK